MWYIHDDSICLYVFVVINLINFLSVQDSVAQCFRYYAELAEALDRNQNVPISIPMETFKSYVLKEPIGVVGLITPWYVFFYIIICIG